MNNNAMTHMSKNSKIHYLTMMQQKIDKNLDLYKSHYKDFIIDEDGKSLIPPFRSIDGLGDIAAKSIYDEARKGPFISVEDFQNRCKVSQTLIDKMRLMGMFNDMPETSQLSLF